MIEIKEICTCNHCLKTVEGIQAINKSKWFHFRKKLNDDETDLTNSVDFCPDCAKLLAEKLKDYLGINDTRDIHSSIEEEIANVYKYMYLDIYAMTILFVIKKTPNETQQLMYVLSSLPGKVSMVIHENVFTGSNQVTHKFEFNFNDLVVIVTQTGKHVTISSLTSHDEWDADDVTLSTISGFLAYIKAPIDVIPQPNIYPKNADSCTISYLLSRVSLMDECTNSTTHSFIEDAIVRIKEAIISIDIIRGKR